MIPGGNDSYGAGLSAGGAQVMGQSQGLNDLVKVAMQRPRPQPKQWNAPLQNIDQSKIKGVDAENVAGFVNKGRDEYIAGNMSNDPAERYRHQIASDNFMAQASELARQSADNQEKFKNYRAMAQDPNIDPTLVDSINKKLHRFEIAKSGTQESEDAEADMGDFHKYQKVDMAKLDLDARSLYEKQKIDTPSNMLGYKDIHSVETMRVNSTAMYHHYADYGRYNTAADNQFKLMGTEAMSNPANKTLIANLAARYPIDPTNAAQVGYAIKANDQYNTAKDYHIAGDHIVKDPKPMTINIGQSSQPALVANSGQTTYTAPQPDGKVNTLSADQNTDYNMAGLPKVTSTANFNGYLPGENTRRTVNGMTNIVYNGGPYMLHTYKQGIALNGTDKDGKPIKRDTKEGQVDKSVYDKFYKNNPERAAQELNSEMMIPVTGDEVGGGKKVRVSLPAHALGLASFDEGTPKNAKGAINRFMGGIVRESAAKNSHIQVGSDGKKSIPGL